MFYCPQHTPAPKHVWVHIHPPCPHKCGYSPESEGSPTCTSLPLQMWVLHIPCCSLQPPNSKPVRDHPTRSSKHAPAVGPYSVHPTLSPQPMDAGCSKGEDMPTGRGRARDADEAASDSIEPDLHYCTIPTPRSLPTVTNFHAYTASQDDPFVSKVSS